MGAELPDLGRVPESGGCLFGPPRHGRGRPAADRRWCSARPCRRAWRSGRTTDAPAVPRDRRRRASRGSSNPSTRPSALRSSGGAVPTTSRGQPVGSCEVGDGCSWHPWSSGREHRTGRDGDRRARRSPTRPKWVQGQDDGDRPTPVREGLRALPGRGPGVGDVLPSLRRSPGRSGPCWSRPRGVHDPRPARHRRRGRRVPRPSGRPRSPGRRQGAPSGHRRPEAMAPVPAGSANHRSPLQPPPRGDRARGRAGPLGPAVPGHRVPRPRVARRHRRRRGCAPASPRRRGRRGDRRCVDGGARPRDPPP